MSGFEALLAELLLLIFDHLDEPDLADLCLTCKHYGDTA